MKMNFKFHGLKMPKFKGSQTKSRTERRIFTAVLVLFSLLAACLFCSVFASLADRAALLAKYRLAEQVAMRAPSASAGHAEEAVFTKNNLFASVIRSPKENARSSAESFVLKGTMPHIGAWISDGGATQLLLLRQEIGGWTLEDVEYGRALLSNNGEICALYISLANGSTSVSSGGRSSESSKSKIDFSAVRKADRDKEGFMPRDVFDKLLLNPYDEIGKMKMVPADGGGMKLENIASDSVLGLCGVQQGDVIKAVNGVNISSLSDLSNAINSMMSGSRFDVSVQRGSGMMDLKYSVR